MSVVITRMHSSRTRTAHLLTVSRKGGVHILTSQGGEGASASWGGGCIWGVGVGGWADTPPMNRMTDRCKNITLPQTPFAGGK